MYIYIHVYIYMYIYIYVYYAKYTTYILYIHHISMYFVILYFIILCNIESKYIILILILSNLKYITFYYFDLYYILYYANLEATSQELCIDSKMMKRG